MAGKIDEIREALLKGVESCFLPNGFALNRPRESFVRVTPEIEQRISVSAVYYRITKRYSYNSHVLLNAPAIEEISKILSDRPAGSLVSSMWFYLLPIEERKTAVFEIDDVSDIAGFMPELKRRLVTYVLPFLEQTKSIDGVQGWLEEELKTRWPDYSTILTRLSLIYALRNDRAAMANIVRLIRNPKIHENHRNSVEAAFTKIERAFPLFSGCFSKNEGDP